MTADRLSFWDPASLVTLPGALPILLPRNAADFRGRWPGATVPSLDQLAAELAQATMCCVRCRPAREGGRIFVDILTGRLLISAWVPDGEAPKLILTKAGVTPALGRDKSGILAAGGRVRVQGVELVSGTALRQRFEERADAYRSGDYVRWILDAPPASAGGGTVDEDDDGEGEAGSDAEIGESAVAWAADLLRQVTDIAHELEDEELRAEPPFQYVARRAEAHRGNVQQQFRLTLPEADHRRLIERKAAMLERMDMASGDTLQMQVRDLEAGAGEIIVSVPRQIDAAALPATGELRLANPPVLRRVREQVIDRLATGQAANRWLLPLLGGEHPFPPFHAPAVEPPPGATPMRSQQEAMNRAAGSPDVFLVLGPPGTGKTTVILAWVRHLVAEGKRILVTSQNNKAVDNVLERLARDPATTCVRLGQEHKVSTAVQPFLIDNCAATLQKRLLTDVETVLADLDAAAAWAEQAPAAIARQDAALAELAAVERRQEDARSALSRIGADLRQARETAAAARTEYEEQRKALNDLLVQQQEAASAGGWRAPFARVGGLWANVKELFATKALSAAEERKRLADRAVAAAQSQLGNLQADVDALAGQAASARARFRSQLPPIPDSSLPPRFRPWETLNVEALRFGARERLLEDARRLADLRLLVGRWRNAVAESRQETLYPQLIAGVDVVGATCIGIHTSAAFRDVQFDVVIADESGQIQVQDLIVPLSRAPKAILVGDHKQLPPIVKPEFRDALTARYVEDDGLMNVSWFEHLWSRVPDDRKAVLDTQFRCPAVISDFISSSFYEGRYHAGPGMAATPLCGAFTSPLVLVDTSLHPRRGESSRRAGGRTEVLGNRLETELAVSLLDRVLAERPDVAMDGEVGIIAPYKSHVEELRRALDQARAGGGPIAELTLPARDVVASVDSFQGQERKLIIVTLTRANSAGVIGFLSDWRRLNVAMTRTRHQLVLIADMATMTRRRKDPVAKEEAFRSAMEGLRTHARRHGQFIDARTLMGE